MNEPVPFGSGDAETAALLEKLHQAGLVDWACLRADEYRFAVTNRGERVFRVLRELASTLGGVNDREAIRLFALAHFLSGEFQEPPPE